MDNEKRLDPDLVIEVARQIDEAAKHAGDANEVADLLKLTEGKSPLKSVALAFQYTDAMTGSYRTGNGQFGPSIRMSDGSQYPPPISQLSPDESALFVAVAGAVTEPIARARLNDISFEARWGRPGDHARAAIEAYLNVPSRDTDELDESSKLRANLATVKSLARALDLARRTKQADQAKAALDAARAAATDAMGSESPGAGVVLGLIDVLVSGAAHGDVVNPLLERARAIYKHNPFLTVATIELQLRVPALSPQHREGLRREIVATWIAEAERNSSMVRMVHLETAVRIARKFGFNDLADEITGVLQSINVDELGLVRNSFPITIPQEVVDGYLNHFTSVATWQDALFLLLQAGPPSGNVESNRAAVAEAARLAPLRALFPRVRLGGDGLPRYTASTETDKLEWQLTEHEMVAAHVQAPVIAQALRRIWQKWGPISENDLGAFFSSSQVHPALAKALARDFLRYFGGDAEGAAYSTAPKVEALVRAIILAIPLPIYRTQRERTPGQYPGLGALMPALIGAGLDESWGRYVYSLLASPMGSNLRNELLHGFVLQVDDQAAALILVAALYLAVGVQLQEAPTSDIDSQAAESPATTDDMGT